MHIYGAPRSAFCPHSPWYEECNENHQVAKCNHLWGGNKYEGIFTCTRVVRFIFGASTGSAGGAGPERDKYF